MLSKEQAKTKAKIKHRNKVLLKTFLKRNIFSGEIFTYSTLKDIILFARMFSFRVPCYYSRELISYRKRNELPKSKVTAFIKNNYTKENYKDSILFKKLDLTKIYSCQYLEAIELAIFDKDTKSIKFFNEHEKPSLQAFEEYKSYIKEHPKSSNLEALQLKYGKNKGYKLFKQKIDTIAYKSSKEYLGEEKYKELIAKKRITLENMIKKYGEEEGTRRWKQFCKKNSYSNTIESYIERYGEEEGTRRYNQWKFDIGKSTRLEYFKTDKNTEEEAKNLLAERQNTFSLDICIKKHGKEKGTKIFNDRQKRWQETLNSKSEEEKKRINQLKGSGMNAGWGIQEIRKLGYKKAKQTFARLYYIRFYNEEIEFWKIGITKFNIDKRFGKENIFLNKTKLKREVVFDIESNFYDAFFNEQQILKNHLEYRIKVNYNKFTSYECFSKDIFKEKHYIITEIKPKEL